MAYQCALCPRHGCRRRDMEDTMKSCPSRDAAVQEKALALYGEEENRHIAYTAATVEKDGYCQLTRIEEIMLFARRMGYRRLGLIFCIGLKEEARRVHDIFTHNGFEVVSAVCKNGGIPKAAVGIAPEQTLRGCADEVMCNPIGQALLMNDERAELSVLLGLCVGHDTLAMKYLEGPATVLAVKDRVTGHNPLAPVYQADSYYKSKLYK